MAFWVPYSDFKIGVEKKDILEYIEKVRENNLPISPQKESEHRTKDAVQQSFSYFIKAKMKLAYYQDADIEIGFKSKKAAIKETQETEEEYKGVIDQEDSIDLTGVDISGLDFEGVTFNSTNLNGVNFDGTLLHNSSIFYTDLSGSKTITKAIVNDRTGFSDGGLSEEQRGQLVKKSKTEKYLRDATKEDKMRFASLMDDSKKALGSIDDPSTVATALDVAKAFILSINPRVSADQHFTSPDQAFDVLRYHYLKTGDETLLSAVEKTSKKYISTEIESALKGVALHSSGVSDLLFTSKSSTYAKRIKQIISDTIEGEIQQDEFLKKHFLIGKREIRRTLMGRILTESFIGEVVKKVDELSAQGNSAEATKYKGRLEQIIVEHTKRETNEWKESQTMGKEKWADLTSLSARKKFKTHVGIRPDAGGFVTRQLPDWCSPLQPSSYPAIDPYDQKAVLKDLALKQDGAKFLAKIGSAGAGASAGALLSAFTSTGRVASATAGVAVAGLSSMFSGAVIDAQFKYKDHKKYNNKMGDKLLELGVIYRTMKPHIETLGVGAVNNIALKYMGGTGYVQETASTFQNLLSTASTYIAYRDFYATKDLLANQSTKLNPLDRKRPGSQEFDQLLKKKLFSKRKLVTSLIVGSALLVAGIVLATAFPAAIPALTAFVAKGVSLQVGAVAVGSFAATAGLTYMSYGVVSKGLESIKNFIKSRSSKARLSAQGEEIMSGKIKASDTIGRSFRQYKLRKSREERSKEPKHTTISHVVRLKKERGGSTSARKIGK